MSREDVDARTSGRIYMLVVQAVMLYGLKTWVITLHIEGFWAYSTTGWPIG